MPSLTQCSKQSPWLPLRETNHGSHHSQQEPVNDISKHNTELKGERYYSEKGWVYLFVARYAIGIHNLLESPGELIGGNKGRSL